MKILITGAAGWVGRYVTELLERSNDLVLTDRVDPKEATIFDPDAPGGRRVEPLNAEWPYLQTDLREGDAVKSAVKGVDAIVHLAARPTGEWQGASETLSTNILGTHTLLERAVAAGVGRLVNASSINAFGTFYWRVSGLAPVRTALPLTEEAPATPEDPYSLSKVTTELMTAAYTRAFGIQTVNLRFAGIWPEPRYDRAMENGIPVATGWAEDLYQWVHVRDVAEGIRLSLDAEHVVPHPIVLSGSDTRVAQPSLALLQEFQPQLLPLLREPLPGRAALLSIARARTQLGFEPHFTLADAPVLQP